ncbi:hypothetical protein M407DRAFT_23896 [Tulasnella calospora MUT 4182]|uniref:Uncharacterized protein n=1 Tax=Tulasnella calospora MUT 4182 TaxID=1051891 RepID=A0A0C3QIT3_9AGAM|nr:hypothetical protein M407DRAFT_23896 [Tulasnella calospora MUT 4182]
MTLSTLYLTSLPFLPSSSLPSPCPPLPPTWPDSLSNKYRNWANGGSYLDWTQKQSIYFSDSRVSVGTALTSWAWSASFGNYAGTTSRTSDGKWSPLTGQ